MIESEKSLPGLRADQKEFEEKLLNNSSDSGKRAIALKLIALYHWAKATEVIAKYILQGEPANPFGLIDKHFDGAIRGARNSGDANHEMIMRWLHATARIMVSSSLWWATRTVNSRTTDFVRSLTLSKPWHV